MPALHGCPRQPRRFLRPSPKNQPFLRRESARSPFRQSSPPYHSRCQALGSSLLTLPRQTCGTADAGEDFLTLRIAGLYNFRRTIPTSAAAGPFSRRRVGLYFVSGTESCHFFLPLSSRSSCLLLPRRHPTCRPRLTAKNSNFLNRWRRPGFAAIPSEWCNCCSR